MEWRRDDGYLISTDPAWLDRALVHAFLASAYWSPGVPRALVERAIDGSLDPTVHMTLDRAPHELHGERESGAESLPGGVHSQAGEKTVR